MTPTGISAKLPARPACMSAAVYSPSDRERENLNFNADVMSKFASACQRKAKSAKPKPPDAAKKERKPWKQEPHTQEQKLQNRTPSKNENRGDESFRNGWKCLEMDQVGAINNLRSFIFGALLQPKIATTWEVVRPVFCSFLITFLRPL